MKSILAQLEYYILCLLFLLIFQCKKEECQVSWNLPSIKIVIQDSLTNSIEAIEVGSFELTPTNYGGLPFRATILPVAIFEVEDDTLIVKTHPHILEFKVEYNGIEFGEIEVDLIKTEEVNCVQTYAINSLRSNSGEICEPEGDYLVKFKD